MRRIFVLGLFAAVLLIIGLAVVARPTEAGSNGQQLRLDVSCKYAPALAEVKVTGYNQRGQRVTWYAKPNARGVVTYGYWWVGKVDIQYKHVGKNPYTGLPYSWYGTSANVPKKFNRDIYPVAVDWGLDCRPAWTP